MFDSNRKRYMTREIANEIDMEVQILLWNLIDLQRRNNLELDYLQIFQLTEQDGKQQIIHLQEVPERKKEYLIKLDYTLPINNTIWCVDDVTHQTMLFPSDY